MPNLLATCIGKLVRLGLIFRPNGGHALPGLVIEKLFPNYVASMLGKLPQGVVVITGTNGKTTTTKIVVDILTAHGRRVLTNQTGSNLIRGIASSISSHATLANRLPFDIAVLEIDEATAKILAVQVKPGWLLGLNVSRDQLDRYGEVDTIAAYIGSAMRQAQAGIVTNAADPHLVSLANQISKSTGVPLFFFGFSKQLRRYFPSDYELAAVDSSKKTSPRKQMVDVQLTNFSGQQVTYTIGAQQLSATLKLTGQHNFLNGAAALCLCRRLLPQVSSQELVDKLADIELAFGRGEKYRLKNGAEIELVLVKNPASFSQALVSYGYIKQPMMIAINDNIADGRDVSWLWDVNFSNLNHHEVLLTSGSRAADMALRLGYDDIKTGTIEPNLSDALVLISQQPGQKLILATYTAMLQLYSILSRQGEKIS